MSFFHKPTGLHAGRMVGYGVFLAIFALLAIFAWKTYSYYAAIKRGDTNPLVDTYLGLSLTHALANTNVTPDDLARLAPATAPTFGSASSSLTIVEFLDFGCPFCQASHGAMREMMQSYGGRVRFVFRDFPVVELHPRAFADALAVRCAHEQGKYLAYHDKLFADQEHHEDVDLYRYAQEIGLNEPQFKSCLQSQKYSSVIQTDIQDGLQAGVQGTPTFFFNGVRIPGVLEAQIIEPLIKRFLAKAPT